MYKLQTVFLISKYLKHISMEQNYDAQTYFVNVPKNIKTILCSACSCINFVPKSVLKLSHSTFASNEKLLLPKKLVRLDMTQIGKLSVLLPKHLKELYMCSLSCHENRHMVWFYQNI